MRLSGVKLTIILILGLVGIFVFSASVQASIVLKVMVANPSREQVQKVPLKTYLPKEVKPEDILEKGDLEIAYDTQQGSYYVYAEYELKPGGVVEREIEMRDIWNIPDTEIESLRLESMKLTDLLKNTEFTERISFLKNNIESKLNLIIEVQKSSPANPEQHISDYRENLKILESVKADLGLAHSLLSQARPLPTVVVWRLIIAIIIFLGILGTSFYFVWQKQAKIITQDTFSSKKDEESFAGIKPTLHKTEEEKKLEPGEIEKILDKEKPEEKAEGET